MITFLNLILLVTFHQKKYFLPYLYPHIIFLIEMELAQVKSFFIFDGTRKIEVLTKNWQYSKITLSLSIKSLPVQSIVMM